MKFEIKNAKRFSWPGIEGYAYMDKAESKKMSCAYINVGGRHGKIKNIKSDRLYFVISGNGKFIVNDKSMDVKKTDAILIPKSTPYDYKGRMKLFLIDCPAFDPKADIKIEEEK